MMFFDRGGLTLAVCVMSLLLIWRHWRNILSLLKGKESRLFEKQPEADPTKTRRRRRRVKRLHDEALPNHDSRSPRSKGNP